MIAKPDEAHAFLDAHPDIQFFEVIYTGLCGVPRGKRLRRHEIMAVYEYGRFLPGSILVVDITGQDCEELVWEDGDADRVGWPVPGTLVPAPWLGADVAQVMLSVSNSTERRTDLDPRHVLARVLDRFAADGLTPVVACELEYYLVDAKRTPDGRIQPPPSPLTGEHADDESAGLWLARTGRSVRLPARTVGGGRCAGDPAGRRDLGICAGPGGTDAQAQGRCAARRRRRGDVQARGQGRGAAPWLRSDLHGQAVRRTRPAAGCMFMSASTTRKGSNIFASDDPEGAPSLRTRSAA